MRRSIVGVLLFLAMWAFGSVADPEAREIVVYTSLDQIFSEPILREFQNKTGIRVKPLYDVEASKTTGLVNRLIAEKDRPKCDVFWNSEIGRTIALKKRGILAPYRSPSAVDIPQRFRDRDDYWTGFAARARVLVYNKNLLDGEDLPESIFELTDPKWQGQVAMAYPLFGTTATHVAALCVALGKEAAEAYLRALKKNDLVIVDGNAVVRDVVVNGEIPIGLTDTDDVNVAVQSGKPVGLIFPDARDFGTLLIPNTVSLIRECRNPGEAKALIDFLLSREVESKLAFSESAQIPTRAGVSKPAHVPDISSIRVMAVDYHEVAEAMDQAAKFCQHMFIR